MPNQDPPTPDTGSAYQTGTTAVLARQLFSGAAYGPDQLRLICQTFDHAWAAIAPLVDDTPLAQEAARLKLANMLLSVASTDKFEKARAKQAPSSPEDVA
jgi:hypothetical protein